LKGAAGTTRLEPDPLAVICPCAEMQVRYRSN